MLGQTIFLSVQGIVEADEAAHPNNATKITVIFAAVVTISAVILTSLVGHLPGDTDVIDLSPLGSQDKESEASAAFVNRAMTQHKAKVSKKLVV